MSQSRRLAETDRAGEEPIPASPPPAERGAPELVAGQAVTGPPEVSATQQNAGRLRDAAASLFCYATMVPAFQGIDAAAYQIYRDRLVADCGGPTDPIEIMIIEQLSLAHFSLGLLSCKAANAGKPEAVGIYAGAAARLMGEFRRSALALQGYRAASRQLAHDPTKDIVLPAEPVDLEDDLEKNDKTTEMGATRRDSDEGPPVIPMQRAASI
jgi:hypothetical protein